MSPRFSIIIPTYNVEKYIARCLESCINQTYKDIEIIVVDDKGSDKSIEIAKSYVSKDIRIKIVENIKNLGTFHTRIEGIKAANGEYILFLDADDYIELNTCEVLDRAIQDSHRQDDICPDIVFFGMKYEPSTWKRVSPKIITNTYFDDNILKSIFLNSYIPPWSVWSKIYKTTLLRLAISHMTNIDRLSMAEDALKIFIVSSIAHKSIGVKNKLYIYCANMESITRKIDNQTRDRKINDIKNVIKNLTIFAKLPIVSKNIYSQKALNRTINILMAVIEREHRYDAPKSKFDFPYIKACIKSLKYQISWQTFIRIILFICSFGRIKI